MTIDPRIRETGLQTGGNPAPAKVIIGPFPGAEIASLAGMGLGWLAMNSVLLAVMLVGAVIVGRITSTDLQGAGGFIAIFGLCSAVVCFVAWLIVGWPVTHRRWTAMVMGDASWKMHGVYGGVSGLLSGMVVALMSESLSTGAVFGGLALVAGAVCGAWAGWKARQLGIRMRLERGELP
jgi:hypothetical protein